MPFPVISDKEVNNKTRIDVSVPSFIEVEGPLGGTSVEYNILLIAEQRILDKNCTSNDIIEFKVSKSFRECEDFYNKICRKFPKVNFPALSKSLFAPNALPSQRQTSLDEIMRFMSMMPEICTSPLLILFLGLEFTNNATETKELPSKQLESATHDNSIFKKMKIKPKNQDIEETDNINSNKEMEEITPENKSLQKNISDDDDEPDDMEDIFKQSRKRNETGSKPLFDELSLNTRSEKIYQSEQHLLFDPQDYGGPWSSEEVKSFLVPGAKNAADRALSTETDFTDGNMELLSIDDDLDEFLETVGKRKSSLKSSKASPLPNNFSEPSLTSFLPSKDPNLSPVLPMSISDTTIASVKPVPRQKPPVPLKPVPAARNQSGIETKSRPVPLPRKQLGSMTKAEDGNYVSSSLIEKPLDTIDILQYIENEKKNTSDEPDLFS